MNRLILVRHGGSTGNEDASFYQYADSALCLTTNGIRQALNTAGTLASIEPRWAKPGNLALEVFASEYFRAQQTGRIVLDQMGLLSASLKIRPLLNERDYGSAYDPHMDADAGFRGAGCETGRDAVVRVQGFLTEIDRLLRRADVMAFSHFGAIRALIANLVGLSEREMMSLQVPNGGAFMFERSDGADLRSSYKQVALSADPVLAKAASAITLPPAAPPLALEALFATVRPSQP